MTATRGYVVTVSLIGLAAVGYFSQPTASKVVQQVAAFNSQSSAAPSQEAYHTILSTALATYNAVEAKKIGQNEIAQAMTEKEARVVSADRDDRLLSMFNATPTKPAWAETRNTNWPRLPFTGWQMRVTHVEGSEYTATVQMDDPHGHHFVASFESKDRIASLKLSNLKDGMIVLLDGAFTEAHPTTSPQENVSIDTSLDAFTFFNAPLYGNAMVHPIVHLDVTSLTLPG